MLNNFLSWVDDHFPVLFTITFGAFLIVCVGAIWAALEHDARAREEFMRSCMLDRKEYECTAMWRAGQANYVPVVVPMVVR